MLNKFGNTNCLILQKTSYQLVQGRTYICFTNILMYSTKDLQAKSVKERYKNSEFYFRLSY